MSGVGTPLAGSYQYIQDQERARHKVLRGIVDRLADSGWLPPGWARDEATDWIWSRTHIDVWQQLVVERNWNS
jgi:hypothetical protein